MALIALSKYRHSKARQDQQSFAVLLVFFIPTLASWLPNSMKPMPLRSPVSRSVGSLTALTSPNLLKVSVRALRTPSSPRVLSKPLTKMVLLSSLAGAVGTQICQPQCRQEGHASTFHALDKQNDFIQKACYQDLSISSRYS